MSWTTWPAAATAGSAGPLPPEHTRNTCIHLGREHDHDRFDKLHEEYLTEWVEDNIRYLYEVCADYVPWTDAKSSSEEER